MPNPATILKALALLQATFPRELSDTMTEVYRAALDDLTDEQIQRATAACIRECTFFPVPAEIRKRAGIPKQSLDVHGVIAAIQSLGEYSPHGWQYPSAARIRERLGAAAAEAYGTVGHGRLYSENETTRGIAERDFSEAFRAAVAGDPTSSRPTLASGPMHPALLAQLRTEHPALLSPPPNKRP